MPPMKDMGVIKQNCRGRPTATPLSTCEGAAAPFNGVHILSKIRPVGGFDTLAELRWADRIGPSIPAEKINHTTINRRGPLYGR